MDQSDEDLMKATQKGDREALGVLVRRYQEQLFAFAVRNLGDREVAGDVFQETFIRVFSRRSTYDSKRKFRPWVYQICLNLCRDHFRKQARKRQEPLEEQREVVDTRPGPDLKLERLQLAERVKDAIHQLPEKQKQVFLLVHYQQLSYPEVAEVLELPLGTVKSRMFHAQKRLAEALEDLRD